MAAKKTATKKPTESAPKGAKATPKPAAKKAAKTASKVAAKKATPAAPAPAKPAPAAKKSAAKPSLDSIARAAYLNYRRRVERGLPGDSHGDWLEAERQIAHDG
ncbi:MAG: hypothetical protein WED15_03725 [Akkermansiaceae bacterium]